MSHADDAPIIDPESAHELTAIMAQLKAWQPLAKRTRQAIHQAPELGFHEHKTRDLIIQKLTEYGVDEIDTRFGGTGVVAVIYGNPKSADQNEGPTIGLRADMDALPIEEENTFSHISTHKNCMHACGHDGHVTMLLLAAKYLATFRGFKGKVILYFQPAEEGLGGARQMIDDEKLFDFYPADRVYALHNWPGIPAGKMAFKPYNVMASTDNFTIHVEGKGGHAGMPQTSNDPLLMAMHIYQGIQGMVSRTFSPLDPVVISVTQIHGGDTFNVIADSAEMNGTIRTQSDEVREDLLARLETLVTHIAKAFGGSARFELSDLENPVAVNDLEATHEATTIARNLLGDENVLTDIEPMMAGDDFSYFLRHIKGCYAFIGNGSDSAPLHNSFYDFNDEILPIGAAYFAALVYGSPLQA